MTVKKTYSIGDAVWVYGVSRSNPVLTEGKIIKIFDLSDCGYDKEPHYLIQIPSAFEPLLEIRTWHTISQDTKGPVGSYREVIEGAEAEATAKKLNQGGLVLQHEEKIKVSPIVVKESKPKPRRPTAIKRKLDVQ
jgi:hypothetical protein